MTVRLTIFEVPQQLFLFPELQTTFSKSLYLCPDYYPYFIRYSSFPALVVHLFYFIQTRHPTYAYTCTQISHQPIFSSLLTTVDSQLHWVNIKQISSKPILCRPKVVFITTPCILQRSKVSQKWRTIYFTYKLSSSLVCVAHTKLQTKGGKQSPHCYLFFSFS